MGSTYMLSSLNLSFNNPYNPAIPVEQAQPIRQSRKMQIFQQNPGTAAVEEYKKQTKHIASFSGLGKGQILMDRFNVTQHIQHPTEYNPAR